MGHTTEHILAQDIMMMDEVGMLGSRQMAAVLEAVQKAQAKAVLMGDPEQLQVIEAGVAFRATAARVGYVELSEIRRQHEGWQMEPTKALALGQTEEGLEADAHRDHVHGFNTKAQAITTMVEQWHETRSHTPDKSQILLAYTWRMYMNSTTERGKYAERMGNWGMTMCLRQRAANGPLPKGIGCTFCVMKRAWMLKTGP